MFDDRRLNILRAAFLFFIGTMMLRLSWLRWPDVLDDFGREVYVPWRLAGGEVLYRDVHYPYGPFSAYLNKFFFSVFGSSIFVVEAFNLLVIIAVAWLVYRLLSRGGDRAAAIASVSVFLTLFAFAQYDHSGGFNFMAPRSHELTHGILLAFAVFLYLRLYLEKGEPLYVGVVGLLSGLAILTRVETGLGVCSAAVAGLVLVFVFARHPGARLPRLAALFMAGLLTPAAVFAVQLSGEFGFAGALGRMFHSWTAFAAGGSQRAVTGMDGPAAVFSGMLLPSLLYGAFVLPLAVNHLVGRSSRLMGLRPYGGSISFVVCAAVLFLLRDLIPWAAVFRPLPLFTAAVSIGLLISLVAKRGEPDAPARFIPLLAWSVFAFVMVLMMAPDARVDHWGFAFVMPSAVLGVHALLSWAPKGAERLSGHAGVFRGAAFAFVAVMALWHISAEARVYSMKTYRVAGAGTGDVITAFDPRVRPAGQATEMVIDELGRITAPGDTVAVLPEGAMVNYLARRINPTGYLSFLPADRDVFDESAVVDAFRAEPPDFIVLAHRDTTDQGPRFFGRDYGREFFALVVRNYEPVYRAGATPLRTGEFGMMILRRRDHATQGPLQ